MLEPIAGDELQVAFMNGVVLALWATLPGWFLFYALESWAARSIRAEFSLRKSEAAELNRAVSLYDKACSRLQEIHRERGVFEGVWRGLFARGADDDDCHAAEREDLEAHAAYLRAAIITLKRRPLRRLRSWVHIRSSQFAFGRALAAHVVGLALLVVAFNSTELSASANEFTVVVRKALVWYPFDERLFHANAVAAALATLTAPICYVMRRVGLRREYGLEFCLLKELASGEPGQPIDQMQTDQPESDQPQTGQGETDQGDEAEQSEQDTSQQSDANEADAENDWAAVLGLTLPTTIDEARTAYKVLIRQNHPDRVQRMSAAIIRVAEAETKKINAAYQQAVISLPRMSRARAAAN
jgi:hypothetical protein